MGVELPIGFGQLVVPFQLIGDSEEMVVTIGYKQNSALGYDATATALQGELFAEAPFAASSISTFWSVGPCRVTEQTALGPQVGVSSGGVRVGTGTVATIPQNSTWLVQKRTSRGGRRGRGRLYFPLCNIAEGNVTPTGDTLAATLASMQLAMDNWHAGASALGLPFYLLHGHKRDPITGEIVELAPPPDLINQLIVVQKIATQRGRLRR